MPHIKGIRLVNVHFNNATQFYDDFKMYFEGKNATYDLENGGGKSLLLLMILQTVLPKSYLRREKPVSLIFQGGKDRTSHVAVEWILEEGSQYKYMLTGFSARKRRAWNDGAASSNFWEDDDVVGASDIEHLNWCVFYNDNKITSLKSAPLSKEMPGRKTYSGFDEIRKYIQQMKQKGLPADIFDTIDKYQSFISANNLIAAEWNIIKGINSGENNIESYFRQNTTSRKLIENQFIKIIEDMEALNKGAKGSDESLLLADTLIEIRSQLNEYLKLKEHLTEFEKIKEYYSEFAGKNEELYGLFKEFESYKSESTGIRNLIKNKMENLDKAIEGHENKIEDNKKAAEEGRNLKRLLEAGLIKFNMDMLIAENEEYESAKRKFEDDLKNSEDKYNHLLALKEYGEYRKSKEKLIELLESLKTLSDDKDILNEKYREAGGKLRFLVTRELLALKQLENKIQSEIEKLDDELNKTCDKYYEEGKMEASLSAEINFLGEKEKLLASKISEIQRFLMENGEMDALLNSKVFHKKLDAEISELESECSLLSERLITIDSEIQMLDIKIAEVKSEIRYKEQDKINYEDWLSKYKRELAELEVKASDLGKSSVSDYKEELELILHRENLNKLELEIESGRLKQKKQLSQERGYYVPNEEVISLYEKLSEKCEFVTPGIDWVCELAAQERRDLVDRLPYLPFSVIMDSRSFEKIKSGRISVDYSSDYMIPIVNVDLIRTQQNELTDTDIFYYCSFLNLILDDEQYNNYIAEIDKKLEVISNDIESCESRVLALNSDLKRVNVFLETYEKSKVEEYEKGINNVSAEIKDLKEVLNESENKKVGLIIERNESKKKIEDLSGEILALQSKSEKLISFIEMNEELSALNANLSEKRKRKELVSLRIKGIVDKMDELGRELRRLQNESQDISQQVFIVQQEKKHVESFDEVANSDRLETVRGEFKSLSDSVSGRIANEAQLRIDIDTEKNRINDLKSKVLELYERDLDGIKEREDNGHRIIIPNREAIRAAKNEKTDLSVKVREMDEKIQRISKAISGYRGKLEVILEGLPEAENLQLPEYDTEKHYKDEIKYTEQLISSYDEEFYKISAELEKFKRELGKILTQAELYDSFISRENITGDEYVAAKIKDFREFENEYLVIQRQINNLCEKWSDRIKTILEESKDFVIQEPLNELSKITCPDSAAQCITWHSAFAEYIANIDEQIQKIGNDIVRLESYQQDFTRRCVQRAELVLGNLKKIESLSRIEVYGRRLNMIELKLPEFEEKEKNLRMKSHIDNIVKEISDEGEVDRKRIALKLSTKELIAQISDMDKAVVRLYKVESIPENSRYYRWEHAVGSEGQNNSLYFIFAACLISFIRMLSITNAFPRTKKVIIADNPFGATSAVYLWEPMFRILKQNYIQLIAPGHRIPREITSRFGVNYILHQDILQDGRLRVVVKDVRVEEDEDVMKFVDSEQLSLF